MTAINLVCTKYGNSVQRDRCSKATVYTAVHTNILLYRSWSVRTVLSFTRYAIKALVCKIIAFTYEKCHPGCWEQVKIYKSYHHCST